MKKLNMDDVQEYVEKHIAIFHQQRLDSVKTNLNLKTLLKHKNPYFYKAKNVFTARQLIQCMAEAYLQSSEETKFGEFMEGLALFVCNSVYGATQISKKKGMDFRFEKDGILYIVECKSGWNWGNSDQIISLKRKSIEWKETGKNIVIVNGCCFGNRKNDAEKAGFHKFCGQDFWYFISNDDELYLKIIEPIGHRAKQKNEEFDIAYEGLIHKTTLEFASQYCDDGGIIDWKKLVKFNSGRKVKSGNKKRN